jgi:hypothetical protein
MPQHTATLSGRIGFLLARVIVPLWIVTGATFKLLARDPRLLPTQIQEYGKALQINPFDLLAGLLAIEFLAVILMVFSARLARPVAIFMLSAFVVVLLNELRTGNFTNCGCLGKIPVKPWQMLTVDAVLLAGVTFFSHRRQPEAPLPLWKPLGAALLTLIALGATYSMWQKDRKPIANATFIDDQSASDAPSPEAGAEQDPTVNPTPVPLPNYFTADDIRTWIGRPWREVELFRIMRRWPSNVDQGTRYVVFYSRTCDHCEQMFKSDLTGPLGTSVTAVEIPASRTQMTAPNAWTMPPTQCELLQLPLGPLWMITPPLALKIENGVITCAHEGDHKKCLDLQ